jgi:hypothetical protein
MIVEVVSVTPAMAKSLLGGNDKNRNLVDQRIGAMASQMKAGLWRLNGETIIVGSSGRLLDGQHRLAAVIVANVDVTMLIARGAPDDVFDTIDVGRTRKTSDILGMAGVRHRFEVGASASNLYKMMVGTPSQVAIPPSYCIEIANLFPSIDGWADRFKHGKAIRQIIGAGTIIPILAYLSDIAERPELAAILFDGLATGQNLSSGDPVLALRNRLISLKAGKHVMNVMNCWGAMVRTVDAMETGEAVYKINATRSTASLDQPKLFKKHAARNGALAKIAGLPRPTATARLRTQADLIHKLVKTPEQRAVKAATDRAVKNQKDQIKRAVRRGAELLSAVS